MLLVLVYILMIFNFYKNIVANTCTGEYICVAFYQCSEDLKPFENDRELIDIRFNETSQCKSYLDVCCHIAHILNDSDVLNDRIGGDDDINSKFECGHRNINGIAFKIFGDTNGETEYGEFPWMIAILVNQFEFNIYVGGGSLIHPSVILTAAHSIIKYKDDKLIARAGEWDTQTLDEIHKHQDRNIKEIIIHNKFDKRFLYYNIALLITLKPFDLFTHIKPVCLPPPQMSYDNHKNSVAIGWGKNEYGKEGKYSVILKKLELATITNEACENKLRKIFKFRTRFSLHESFICAGGSENSQKKNTCDGDGGSPLSYPIPGKKNFYYQNGIVSWGTGCGTDDPGIYTNVAFLRSWIDFNLAKRKLSYQYYTKLK